MEEKKKYLKPRRVPMWLPYLQSIKETRKGVFEFVYKGGAEVSSLDNISSIMIYGDTDTKLDVVMLDKIIRKGIPIIIHRRTMSQPIYIYGGLRPDPEDTVSKQIMKREFKRTSTHISRQLLDAKMRGMNYLVKPKWIPKITNIKMLRNIEAVHAKRYWERFFKELGHPEWTRRGKNPASVALDASSKFLSGIVLRWICYHHLSPYHGFLHETTDYPSLVYDLLEPYRGMFEAKLLKMFTENSEDKWLAYSIVVLKEALDEQVYVPLTRQIVTRQELLHGAVLSLKYYLLGKQRKFLIPVIGKPNGGRPPKVEFLLYGRHAGKTDFWVRAHEISERQDVKRLRNHKRRIRNI